MKHEGDSGTNCALGTISKWLLKGLEDIEIRE